MAGSDQLAVAAILILALQADRYGFVEAGDSSFKVFNELNNVIINFTIQSSQDSIHIKNLSPQGSASYKAVRGDAFWNVSVKSSQGQEKFGVFEFKSNHQYGLVIHNRTTGAGLYVLDVTKGGTSKEQKMGLEQAFVVISSNITSDVHLFGVTTNCYKCEPQRLGTVYSGMTSSLIIDSRWKYRLLLESLTGGKCSFNYHFQENWHYQIAVTQDAGNKIKCILQTQISAANPYIPIAVMFAIYAALIILYQIFVYVSGKVERGENGVPRLLSKKATFTPASESRENVIENQASPTPQKKARLRSLDTFRGIAISVMIFVNYGGGGYYFFEHSRWNGLTVADLVFPWFIFIMGTSILLSQKSLLANGAPRLPVFWKLLIRSCKLFLIGFFLSKVDDITTKRIPGVLQRFAISYLVVAVVNLFCSPRGAQLEQDKPKWYMFFADILMYWFQWLIMLGILVIYLLITFLVDVPGCPSGYLGPGGIGDYGKYPKCTGGAAGYIDRWFFTENHIYNHPTCKKIYLTTEAYDPEGMVGSLTSIFLTFLGLQAGRILTMYSTHRQRIFRWIAWGILLGVIAMGLSGGTKNEGVMPINKNLWSVSFIFATGSLAYFLLAFLYLIIDINHWWKGGPFFFAGMNAIFLYCGHEVFHDYFPFSFVVHPSTHASRLARAAVGATLWVAISYYMYCQKIFFKV